jgi:hypothetical protein
LISATLNLVPSLTWTVKLTGPEVAGVKEMRPVKGFMLAPVGSPKRVYDNAKPEEEVASTCIVIAMPLVAFCAGIGVMAGGAIGASLMVRVIVDVAVYEPSVACTSKVTVPVAADRTVMTPVAGSIVTPAGSPISEYVKAEPFDEVAVIMIEELVPEVAVWAGTGLIVIGAAGAALIVISIGIETVVTPSLA